MLNKQATTMPKLRVVMQLSEKPEKALAERIVLAKSASDILILERRDLGALEQIPKKREQKSDSEH